MALATTITSDIQAFQRMATREEICSAKLGRLRLVIALKLPVPVNITKRARLFVFNLEVSSLAPE